VSLYGRIFAAAYDGLVCGGAERAGLSAMRARLLSSARGRTLEIGAGTGLNLRYYPDSGIELTVTEPEEPMVKRLRRKALAERADAKVLTAPADDLPFADGSVDTVVSTLVLCTVPDQAAALAEIRRVLSPDGELLFLEHVRSDEPRVSRLQDRLQPVWFHLGRGCHLNLDTLAAIRAAGFEVDVEHDRMPKAPAFVRPLIIGRARYGSE
jgi:ubiquinone/menaquinone biosynthesis C-methylase UbiE